MDKQTGKQSTDAWIDDLADKLAPVEVATLGVGATTRRLGIVLGVIAGLMAFMHLRPDVAAGHWPHHLATGLVGALLAAVAACHASVRLLVPGRGVPTTTLLLAACGVALMVVSAVVGGVHVEAGGEANGMKCALTLCVFAVAPAVILAVAARRQAPTRLPALGLGIGLTAAAAGFGALLLVCGCNEALHLTLYHLLPAIALSLAASAAAKTALRW